MKHAGGGVFSCCEHSRSLAWNMRKLPPGSERVTDKMPSDWYFAGLIRLALPTRKSSTSLAPP